MKRLLLISNIIIAFTQVSAQSVSYTYKPLAAQGCSVEYSAIWQEGSPYIVVAISSDRLVFNETPTMMIRTLNDELIKSEGKAITASTSQGGIIVSNVVVPVTGIRATAQFPITVEQIEMMKNDYSYSTKSDLIIELLELGIISFYKEKDRDTKIDIMLERLNLLLDKIND